MPLVSGSRNVTNVTHPFHELWIMKPSTLRDVILASMSIGPIKDTPNNMVLAIEEFLTGKFETEKKARPPNEHKDLDDLLRSILEG